MSEAVWVTLITVVLGGSIGTALASWLKRKPTPVEGLSPVDAETITKGEVAAHESADPIVRYLVSQLESQGARIRQLEISEGILVRFLRRIRRGVEAGTIPPWPDDEPDEVTIVFSRYPE